MTNSRLACAHSLDPACDVVKVWKSLCQTALLGSAHLSLHTLSGDLFPEMEKTWIKNATARGQTRTMITSPQVVLEAKSWNDCSTILGAELEGSGGDGTVGGHWEDRWGLNASRTTHAYHRSMVMLSCCRDIRAANTEQFFVIPRADLGCNCHTGHLNWC